METEERWTKMVKCGEIVAEVQWWMTDNRWKLKETERKGRLRIHGKGGDFLVWWRLDFREASPLWVIHLPYGHSHLIIQIACHSFPLFFFYLYKYHLHIIVFGHYQFFQFLFWDWKTMEFIVREGRW